MRKWFLALAFIAPCSAWAQVPIYCQNGTTFAPCSATNPLAITGTTGTTTSSIGAANSLPAQVSMSTTAAQIVAARTGAAGTGRVAVTIVEPSTCGTLYIGPTSGVTTSTGFPIVAGAAITLNTTSALYGILASGTCTTSEVETY